MPAAPSRPANGANGADHQTARALELLPQRKELPIWSARKKLIQLIRDHDCVVLVGETGSGKTTQSPQFVLQQLNPAGQIACTQPRRVAAITVAQRVAEELGVAVGAKVGYCVRFDDCTSPDTRLKYMTDGMLIREAVHDPALYTYSVVFVDEAHERTVNTDVLLGLLQRAQRRRAATKRPLKLVVMSATLDQSAFLRFFEGSVPAYVQGRQFPVQIMYTAEPQDSYLQSAINAIFQVHEEEARGSILVFLTGQDEIEQVRRILEEDDAASQPTNGFVLVPVTLYAAMPPEEQAKAFVPEGPEERKVILATNIAETSVTIPGIRYVIDTGMVKIRAHSARRGIDSLQVVPVSQAQARQRSGRAGREAAGKAFRLFPEAVFGDLPSVIVPEIQRTNLASVVLQLKAVGVEDVLSFPFIDPPPRQLLLRALQLLYSLGAMEPSGVLTERGSKMARLPVDAPLAAFILHAAHMRCAHDAMAIVSLLSADRVFVTPKQFAEDAATRHRAFQNVHGDHITLLNVFNSYQAISAPRRVAWCRQNFLNSKALVLADKVYQQLEGLLTALDLQVGTVADEEEHVAVRQAMVCGLCFNAATRQPDGSYKILASGVLAALHPASTLHGAKPECVIFDEVVHTNRTYLQRVTTVDAAWLPELVPRFFSAQKEPSLPH